MRWIPIQTRTSPLLPQVALKGAKSASESEQNDPPSSLASDAEQYERMQASYAAVGRDFKDQEAFIGSEYQKAPASGVSSSTMAPCETLHLFAKMCWTILTVC